jgi:uncharacterized damage-inducible protein DinB
MPNRYFALLAQHSAWANRRLYQACERLSPAEYWCERRSSFGSLHATLNHVLLTDRVWIARIEGRTPPCLGNNQNADLVGLRVARVAEDEHLRHLVAGLLEATLDLPLHYIDCHGERCEMPLRWVLAHLFDAQSRYRGEALALLVQAGTSAPCLDLLAFLRSSEGSTRR